VNDPVRVRRSVVASAAVIYDSPHSGRFYPPDFQTKASREELRRGEDAYVDELLDGAPSLGVTVLDATYPRCYIDLNRAETDIDVSLLSEPQPERTVTQTDGWDLDGLDASDLTSGLTNPYTLDNFPELKVFED